LINDEKNFRKNKKRDNTMGEKSNREEVAELNKQKGEI
jgi:hypothetical protein